MKIVIQTQYRENYAAHNEGYVHGVSEPHWKFKGGETFVLSCSVRAAMDADFRQAAFDAISFSNEIAEEYVIDYSIIDDALFDISNHIEKWEFPTYLSHDGENFTAKKITDNRPDEDGYRYSAMRDEILELVETWTVGPENERLNYKGLYLMTDGSKIPQEKIRQWIKEAA